MQILVGKVSQEGTDGATITFLFNPFHVEVVSSVRSTQGTSIVTLDRDVLNPAMPPKYYTANSTGDRYVVSQTGTRTFEISSVDPTGEPEDNRLSGNLFELDTY